MIFFRLQKSVFNFIKIIYDIFILFFNLFIGSILLVTFRF